MRPIEELVAGITCTKHIGSSRSLQEKRCVIAVFVSVFVGSQPLNSK